MVSLRVCVLQSQLKVKSTHHKVNPWAKGIPGFPTARGYCTVLLWTCGNHSVTTPGMSSCSRFSYNIVIYCMYLQCNNRHVRSLVIQRDELSLTLYVSGTPVLYHTVPVQANAPHEQGHGTME